ncbi:hypothetical protein [Peribacillus kribbensis]|uniref:hypothetical protein n=1 Tax=Peribacillus kribbensis TaxID=356658 RepID=UPI00042072E0|nr:hypothetical protein [Peribacillus kribbensis]
MRWLQLVSRRKQYDVTIFQTPFSGENKGYQQVYQLGLSGATHKEVLDKVFSMFNVLDSLPKDFKARYIFTGDILLIDDGLRGKYYYKLQSGGWAKIQNIQVS